MNGLSFVIDVEAPAYRRRLSHEEIVVTPPSIPVWTIDIPDYDTVMSNNGREAVFTEIPPPSYDQVMLGHDLWLVNDEKCNLACDNLIKKVMKIKPFIEIKHLHINIYCNCFVHWSQNRLILILAWRWRWRLFMFVFQWTQVKSSLSILMICWNIDKCNAWTLTHALEKIWIGCVNLESRRVLSDVGKSSWRCTKTMGFY